MADQQPGARKLVRRAPWTGLLLLGCMSVAIAAEQAAELDDEFLEYLGSLESDADNWMDFTAEAVTQRKRATLSSEASSSASSSVRNPTELGATKLSATKSSDSSAASKTDAGKADK